MKKRYYYIIGAIFNASAIILFWRQMRISWYSLVPIVLFVCGLGSKIARSMRYHTPVHGLKYNGEYMEFSGVEMNLDDIIKDMFLTDAVLIPLLVPMIFFFGDVAKALLSVAVYLGGTVAILIYYFRQELKAVKAQSVRHEKELEEQKRREEMGFYK